MSYIHGFPLEQSHEHTFRQIYPSTLHGQYQQHCGVDMPIMFGEGDIEIEVGETLGILHVNRAA